MIVSNVFMYHTVITEMKIVTQIHDAINMVIFTDILRLNRIGLVIQCF